MKNTFSSVVNEAYHKQTRVLVEKAGIPVAALVSVDDLRRLTQLDCAWDERTRAIERFSKAFADVPVDELKPRLPESLPRDERKVRRNHVLWILEVLR